ncbi:MAG: FHA domain-containing protein [Planctomycetales bacterium]
MASLVLLQDGKSQNFALDKDEAFVGRLPECEIQLDSNMVSRKHARVFRDGGQFFIEDLGSGNGTTVNGERLAGRRALIHADRIKIGPMLLRYEAKATSGGGQGSTYSDSPDSATFGIQLSNDDAHATQIMGALTNASPLGSLQVRPEAKLKGVVEITRSLAGVVDLDTLLPKILDTLFGIFPQADRGCILLHDDVANKLRPKAIKRAAPMMMNRSNSAARS